MTAPLLFIGLDAAEIDLVAKWMGDGTMPNLKRLAQNGNFQALYSSADWLSGSAWTTVQTGLGPADHGHYHYIQWQQETMSVKRALGNWLAVEPCWRDIARRGKQVIAFDMPFTLRAQPQANLIEVGGWATHDLLDQFFAVPQDVASWLHTAHGDPIRSQEYFHLLSAQRFCLIRDELIRETERVTAVALDLMQQRPWDLFLIGFGATHRGGHKLWDTSCITDAIDSQQRIDLENALREVYGAVDHAVGRLVAAAGNAVTLVCAAHGMGANTSYAELLPQMLSRILSGTEGSEPYGWLRQAREHIPYDWRMRVKNSLPFTLQDYLTSYWRIGRRDWSKTRAMVLVADKQGYIRINLRGREAQGIVEPGAEYDALCRHIIDGLASFVDADRGQPIVKAVARPSELYPPGARLHRLPDLIVRWTDSPVSGRRAITSQAYGSIPWPTPGQMPDGRSGNHRSRGFLLSDLPFNTREQASTTDIAPTMYALLDLPIPKGLPGRPFTILEADRGH